MDNRTAIITGGAQGIGKAVARQFLDEGLTVVIADADPEACVETAEEYRETGRIRFVHTDVSDEESVKNLVNETVKLTGRIDILVNNAAILDNRPLEKLDLASWKRVLDVNLTGAFLCSKYCLPWLKKNKNGNIVNIASTRAFQSEANTEAYSASKGGIVALTHALAVSLGPDIRVNCISPGWIETRDRKKKTAREEVLHSKEDREQHPAGRVGTPEDIASMVSFLCSDKGSFITGANYLIDGGMNRKMIYRE